MPKEVGNDDSSAGSNAAADKADKRQHRITSGIEKLSIAEETEYDPELFNPPPPQPDCPICLLPLSFQGTGGTFMSCCGNSICASCLCEKTRVKMETDENRIERNQPPLPMRCPFCRGLATVSEKEEKMRFQKRLEANDPSAYQQLAMQHMQRGKIAKTIELMLKAADLGLLGCYRQAATACSIQSLLDGGDSEKNKSTSRRYLEMGAKKGSIGCHYDLGELEFDSGNVTLAYKHFCFGAENGDSKSLDKVQQGFRDGHVTKDEYATALRAFQKVNDATMSPERHLAVKVVAQWNKQEASEYEAKILSNNGK